MGKDGKSNINHGKTMGKTWEILIPTSHASHHPQTGSPPSMAMTKRNRFELELPIPYMLGLIFREYPHKIWSYMVLTYLHFRILKFPLKHHNQLQLANNDGHEDPRTQVAFALHVGSTPNVACQMRQKYDKCKVVCIAFKLLV